MFATAWFREEKPNGKFDLSRTLLKETPYLPWYQICPFLVSIDTHSINCLNSTLRKLLVMPHIRGWQLDPLISEILRR